MEFNQLLLNDGFSYENEDTKRRKIQSKMGTWILANTANESIR